MKTQFYFPLLIGIILVVLGNACTTTGAFVGIMSDRTKAKEERTVLPENIDQVRAGNRIVVYIDELALEGRYVGPIFSTDPQTAVPEAIMIRCKGHEVTIPWNYVVKIDVLAEKRNGLIIGALAGAVIDAVLIIHVTNTMFDDFSFGWGP